jgi:hypothetical protein
MDRYFESIAKNAENSKLVDEFRTKPDEASNKTSQQTFSIL